MSKIGSYPTRTFSETQKFLVLDPQTGNPSFVQGRDLVKQLTPNDSYVFSEATRATAQATDYELGAVIHTGGATSTGDGQAGVYLVVPSGDGDLPMDNGLELLTLAGDDTLLKRLALNTSGDGSDLITHTGTSDTVTEALDRRTIYAASIADLQALNTAALRDGQQASVRGVTFRWSGGEWLNVSNFITLEAYGAVGDGISDDSDAVEQCLTGGVANILFRSGATYRCTRGITVKSDRSIWALGAVLHFDGAFGLKFEGETVDLGAIFGAAASVGDQTITLTNTSGVAVGDYLMLQNTADFSFSNYRASYTDGEVARVVGIEGSIVTLDKNLETSYGTAANYTVTIVDPVQAIVSGLEIRSGGLPLSLNKTAESELTDVKCYKDGAVGSYAALFIISIDDEIRGGTYSNLDDGSTGNGYGLCLAGAWGFSAYSINCYSRRHAVSVGSAGGTPPNRHLRFYDSVFKSYAHTANNTHAADFHGHVDDGVFVNCVAYGGVVLGGSNARWVGGKIVGNAAQAPMSAREVPKGVIEYSGVTVVNNSASADMSPHSTIEHDRPAGDIEYKLNNLEVTRTDPSNTREHVAMAVGEDASYRASFTLQSINIEAETTAIINVYSRDVGAGRVGNVTIEDIRYRAESGFQFFAQSVVDRLIVDESRIKVPTQTTVDEVTLIPGGSAAAGFAFNARYPGFKYTTPVVSVVSASSSLNGNINISTAPLSADGQGRYYYTTTHLSDPESSLSESTTLTLLCNLTCDSIYYG